MMRAWLLVALVACGGDGDGGGGGLFGGDPELDGTWKINECASGGTSTLVVTGSDVEFTHSYFSVDGKCDVAPFAVRKDVERYAFGDASASAAGAIEVDVTTVEGTMMVTAQPTADHWNQMAYCGYTDWAPNVARDILGRTCSNTTGGSVTYWTKGSVFYDIYKVDGAKLQFGDYASGNGESAATRPTKLDAQSWTR